MPELDLGPAIEAAAKALWATTYEDEIATPPYEYADDEDRARCREVARNTIKGALPELRKAIAEELKEFARQAAKTDSPDAILGLLTASVIVSGQRFDSFDALADELDELVHGQSGGGE